jgi:type IV secretion system protein VirB3
MADAGSLKSDPLFVGLTRPPLFLGVSMSFAMLNIFACMLYYVQTSDLKSVLIGCVLHLIGYIICFKEPLFIELILMRSQKCSLCKNKIFHGNVNSYDMY